MMEVRDALHGLIEFDEKEGFLAILSGYGVKFNNINL